MRQLLQVFVITALLAALLPVAAVQAQASDPVWVERLTPHFTIVYAQGGEADAEYYASFADEVYAWEHEILKVDLAGPLLLRLFPTLESYFKANPIAANVPGVVAHANAGRREIAIALPRTRDASPEDQQNNLRHELAHLFAAALTQDKLPTGFHEGFAQYFERPTAELNGNVELLRQARDQGRLLNWTELNEPGRAYTDPQVAYPEARSVVAYLVDRYGFARLLDFLEAMRTEPGYRSALEAAYGASADALEAEWLDSLPDYLDGRWKIHALFAYDLSRAQQLLDEGAYTPAAVELQAAVDLLETTDQPEALARAQEMLRRSQDGQAAHALADAARQALDSGDYAGALRLVAQANAAFAALEDTARMSELDAYAGRVAAVRSAKEALAAVERQATGLDLFTARRHGLQLAGELGALGDRAGAERAAALVGTIDHQVQTAAGGLLALAIVLLLANAGQRLLGRHRAGEDVEATLL